MTITDAATPPAFELPEIPNVSYCLYRTIHKAIRVDLFTVTASAGRIGPDDLGAIADLAADLRTTEAFLASHAEHEDRVIGPVLQDVVPLLGGQIEEEHEDFDGKIAHLIQLADATAAAPADVRRGLLQHLYLDLTAFTGSYLAHQDIEERQIMPALSAAIGLDEILALEGQILGGIPPDEMAAALALMLPAMNRPERAEMLGGMRAGAPPEVFEGVWGLAGSVLTPADLAALAASLGL